MELIDIFKYLVVWTVFGAVLFNVYVIFVFRSGLVYTTRHEDGTLKRQQSIRGVLNSLLLLALIVGLLILSNLYLERVATDGLSFLQFFTLNFGLYLLLFLYDTFVIDYYVIGRWRPSILKIPEDMNAESMNEHINASLKVGPIIGLVLAALSAGISFLFLLG